MQSRVRARRALLVAVVSCLAPLVAPAGAHAAAFAPCSGTSTALCAEVEVPLDRSGAVPGAIRLDVRRIPAAQGPAQGTLLFLAGGPGQSAIEVLPELAELVADRLPRYDIVAFDQRGTGRSDPLSCAALEDSDQTALEAFAKCGEQLGPARAFYRTTESVDDLEAVRQELGSPQLSIYAVSYGARVAGEYARRYPSGVARLALDSPSPLSGIDPFDLSRQAALPRVLDEICAGEACADFTRSPYKDLSQLAARLKRKSLRGTAIDSRGRPARIRLTVEDLFGLVASSDVDPVVRPQIPSAVRSALRGDEAPLLRAAARGLGGSQGSQDEEEPVSQALFAATTCAESPLPWNPGEPPSLTRVDQVEARIDQLGSRAFAPFGSSVVVGNGIIPRCLGWPAVPRPPVAGGLGPSVPVLVLSGSEDLRTPLADAEQVAAGYSQARILAVPFTGHSTVGTDVSECAANGLASFLGGRPPAACSTSADQRPVPVSPLAPTRLASLRPAGASGVRGQTLAALDLTVIDAFLQLPPADDIKLSLGGLRGGRLVAAKGVVTLSSYEYIPGVELSGQLRQRDDVLVGTLRVGGEAAAAAIVRFRPNGSMSVRFLRARRPAFTGSVVVVKAPSVAVPEPEPAPALKQG